MFYFEVPTSTKILSSLTHLSNEYIDLHIIH